MRRAESYPCPFCTVTKETRKTAQAHTVKRHYKTIARRAKKGVMKK